MVCLHFPQRLWHGKIIGGQFYRRGHLPPEVAQLPLASAGPFELAWTFMGYSFAYILFIGLTEIVGAWMLLWERTKLLGVAILPVMVNIIVFDIIFLDKYGALASAAIYTILLFVILCHTGLQPEESRSGDPGADAQRSTGAVAAPSESQTLSHCAVPDGCAFRFRSDVGESAGPRKRLIAA
jgi:hypothetical protein